MDNLRIRSVILDDLDDIYQLEELVFGVNDSYSKKSIKDMIEEGKCLCIEKSGVIIGHILCKYISTNIKSIECIDFYRYRNRRRIYTVMSLAVHPNYRGEGVATILLEEIVKILQHELIVLQCRVSNKKAIDFYNNRGYQKYFTSLNNFYDDGEEAYMYILNDPSY